MTIKERMHVYNIMTVWSGEFGKFLIPMLLRPTKDRDYSIKFCITIYYCGFIVTENSVE